ncbi:fumarylacetoacetate hydrolase [Mycena olivaceomarginata]|nr:fumarylacetoacetate hydrolase [Mycena olivaceomarginata]
MDAPLPLVAAETSQVHIGQPVDPSLESLVPRHCGSALDPAVQVSKTVLTVKQLLSPLSREEVKYVRCLGLNYADNAAETNLPLPPSYSAFPVLFAKPVTLPTGAGATVVIPKAAQPVKEHCPDYEPARDVSEANALDYVLGYTAANDMAVSQWMFSKGFDYTNPLGPVPRLRHRHSRPPEDPAQMPLNGNVVQNRNMLDRIFTVRHTPGSVILTGTPKGVRFVKNPPL